MSKLARDYVKRNPVVTTSKPVDKDSEIMQIIKTYRLEKYFDAVNSFYFSRPNYKLFYHGFKHIKSAAIFAAEGCHAMKLDYTTTTAVVLGMLFHDINHSLGNRTDFYNIGEALHKLHEVHNSSSVAQNRVSATQLTLACECIRHTQFPYTPKETTVVAYQVCRDADLMHFYLPVEECAELLYGFYNEQRLQNGKLTLKDFIQKNIDFCTTIRWSTKWAYKKSIVENFPKRVKDAHFYLERRYTEDTYAPTI